MLLLLMLTANDLQVEGGDIENACLDAPSGEKVCTIAGLESGDKEGMEILIRKASCSSKTLGRKLWESLAGVFRKIGFAPNRHSNIVWIKSREDRHDHAATHADDAMVAAKDSKAYVEKIKEIFNLMPEGNVDYFLGNDTR